jgi:hypothetical protein
MKTFFKKPSERLELSTGETSRCLTLPEEPDVATKSEVKRTHGHLFIIRYLWDQQAMVKKILRILKEVDKAWCLFFP